MTADTKDSILNAAERLFAERGFESTSLRAITAAAGVNLAAVNYHFHSKEQLLQALFTRRLEMVNRKRMSMMDVYEAVYGGKPIPLVKLVRALIEPMFDITGDRSTHGRAFSLLLGRMYSSPQGHLDNILITDIEKFTARFESAIRRTLPGIPPEDLYWRAFFAIGATAHTLAASHLLGIISHGLCSPDDREAALERLVTFVVAGLKTPAEPEKTPMRPTRSAPKIRTTRSA